MITFAHFINKTLCSKENYSKYFLLIFDIQKDAEAHTLKKMLQIYDF
jgi:hypothetical protein